MKSLKETAERMMTSFLDIVETESDSFDTVGFAGDEEVVIDNQLNREAPQNLIELCW